MSTRKLRRCFKEGETKERHQGLKKIKIEKERINNHILKAEHNLKSMIYFKKGGFSDWSASASFYTLYHCLLALIAKYGYESRNQKCTFLFVGNLIEKEEISISKDDLKEIFDKDVEKDLEHSDKILDIRERMQYSSITEMEDETFKGLFERTKELFNKIKREVEK